MEEFLTEPEFSFVTEEVYKNQRTEFSSGYVQTRPYWLRPKRRFTLNWDAAIQDEVEAVRSFFRDRVGSGESFLYQPADPVPSPQYPGTASTATQTVGSYGSRTYYYTITWVTTQGETKGGVVKSLALSANQLFKLTLPRFPPNVASARIYVGTASNTVQIQTETSFSRSAWTEPDVSGASNGLLSGATPPTTNTAYEKATVFLENDSVVATKVSPVSYQMNLVFEEQMA